MKIILSNYFKLAESAKSSRIRKRNCIWIIEIEVEGNFQIPVSQGKLPRSVYFYEGTTAFLNGEEIKVNTGVFADSKTPLMIRSKMQTACLLLL